MARRRWRRLETPEEQAARFAAARRQQELLAKARADSRAAEQARREAWERAPQEWAADPAKFDAFMKGYDWFTAFSDDYSVWAGGEAVHRRLMEFLKGPLATDEHKRIYNRYHAAVYDNDHWVHAGGRYELPFPEAGK